MLIPVACPLPHRHHKILFLQQATLPMTQAQIANLQQQATAFGGNEALFNLLFGNMPQQQTIFTPQESQTLENLWESDANTSGMSIAPQTPQNPLLTRSYIQ